MKKRLFIIGLIMMCGAVTGCESEVGTNTGSYNNMKESELTEYLDGGDIGSDKWYQENYGD